MNVKLLLLILFHCLCLKGVTQVCSGSLGDPVVNITFGAGSNPGPSLPAGSSSYSYSLNDCPGDGEYAVRNVTFSCFTNSWHTVPFDHTPGDGNNGYFLEINGGDQRDYYTRALTGLCANTTYELSFWVMNISKASACGESALDPNIKFSIENTSGMVMATAATGNVSKKIQPSWTQYSLLFKTDGSTSVVLRLSNNGGSGCGMDFLLDDITVRPCGPSIIARIAPGGTATGQVCEGDSAPIFLNTTVGSGFLSPQYQWQESTNGGNTWTDIPGANSPDYARQATAYGNYRYRALVGERANIGSSQCRLSSNAIDIIVERAPFAQGTNYSYCLGQDVTLFAAGGTKYSWSGPNNFSSDQQSPVIRHVQFSDSGLYKVQVTTSAGCRASDSTHLYIFSNPVAFINPEVSICEETGTQLLASGGSRYSWTPSKGLSSDTIANPFARPADSTIYTVTVTENGCYDTASVRVNVWKKPSANAGPDKKIRRGQSVSLSGSAKGTEISYFWTPVTTMNNPNILSPVVNTKEDTRYVLHVVSNKGCGTSSDDVLVKIFDKITVPNAFSPNGDGINDAWIIEPLILFEDAETLVFNRYGQLVFTSHGYSKPWNGKLHGQPLPAGTYYYTINLKDENPLIKGWVLIIR
jgi:gliding motility-associated-like protein